MKELVIAVGAKENLLEDLYGVTSELVDEPELVIASGKDLKNTVIRQASNLFIGEKVVIAIIDPARETVDELRGHIAALRERIPVVLFSTNPADKIGEGLDGRVVVLEQDKEKRLKARVRRFLKTYEKKMTDKAFDLLMARIRDESLFESELEKLIAFVGEKNTIESKDIRAIVSETHEETLMTLFEAFQKSNKKEMLSVLENLMENGQHILSIHSYLVNQMRLLLQTKDMENLVREGADYNGFSKAFKEWKGSFDLKGTEKRRYLPSQHPFYAFKLSKVGRGISEGDLLAFYDMLAQFDIQVKSGTKHDRVRLEYGLVKA